MDLPQSVMASSLAYGTRLHHVQLKLACLFLHNPVKQTNAGET